eukprot:2372062-Pleurochrysis_carterae.AAC.1
MMALPASRALASTSLKSARRTVVRGSTIVFWYIVAVFVFGKDVERRVNSEEVAVIIGAEHE